MADAAMTHASKTPSKPPVLCSLCSSCPFDDLVKASGGSEYTALGEMKNRRRKSSVETNRM